MTGATSLLASAAVGSLLVVGLPTIALGAAGRVARSSASPVARLASSAAPGSISGVVRDERGLPVPNVVVSALGAVTTSPSPTRPAASSSARSRRDRTWFAPTSQGSSRPARRWSRCAPALEPCRALRSAAKVRRRYWRQVWVSRNSGAVAPATPRPRLRRDQRRRRRPPRITTTTAETAWRIRHARKSVLKDATLPEDLLADSDGWLVQAVDVRPDRRTLRAVSPACSRMRRFPARSTC